MIEDVGKINLVQKRSQAENFNISRFQLEEITEVQEDYSILLYVDENAKVYIYFAVLKFTERNEFIAVPFVKEKIPGGSYEDRLQNTILDAVCNLETEKPLYR